MDQVIVCRVCLITDVKMYDLRLHPMDYYVKAIESMEKLSSSELPPYACFECAAMIKNTYNFTEKYNRGHTALFNVICSMGKITEDKIKKINRNELNLISNLSRHNISAYSVINVSCEETEICTVKNEPFSEDVDNKPKCDMNSDSFKHEISNEEMHVSTDDNDEPLIVHKKKKQTLKQKTLKKKENKINKETNSDKDSDSLKQDSSVEETCLSSDDNNEPLILYKNNKVTLKEKTLTNKRQDSNKAKSNKKTPQLKASLNKDPKAAPAKSKVRKKAVTSGGDGTDNLEEFVTIIVLSKEEQLQELEKRKTSSNYAKALFKCELCYKGFIDDAAWKHHLSRHDPKVGEFECEICKLRFKSKRKMVHHLTIHQKRYACKACPYVSTATNQAKQHQRWHKGIRYTCQLCGEVCTTSTTYLGHLRLKHPSQHVCGACGYSFVSARGLAMHKSKMHWDDADTKETEVSNSEDDLHCATCDVTFATQHAYRRHLITSANHTDNKNVEHGCRACGEAFPSAEALRAHRAEHARKMPKEYYKKTRHEGFPRTCALCTETVDSPRAYYFHCRRAHRGQKYPMQWNYVCDVCGQTFRTTAFLKYHTRTHTSERPFKCTECPKAFTTRTNLTQHQRSHSDRKPFSCVPCRRSYKSKHGLDRHLRSSANHNGERPYACSVCGKAFGESSSVKTHVLTVHMKQPAPHARRARAGPRQ